MKPENELQRMYKKTTMEIMTHAHEIEVKTAKILQTQQRRIKYDPFKQKINIDLSRNRHVIFTIDKLKKIRNLLKAEDIHISTPIRCKIEITPIHKGNKQDEKREPENPIRDKRRTR